MTRLVWVHILVCLLPYQLHIISFTLQPAIGVNQFHCGVKINFQTLDIVSFTVSLECATEFSN